MGFHAIELHSSNNNDYPMTEEQKEAARIRLAEARKKMTSK